MAQIKVEHDLLWNNLASWLSLRLLPPRNEIAFQRSPFGAGRNALINFASDKKREKPWARVGVAASKYLLSIRIVGSHTRPFLCDVIVRVVPE
jgi:hypothetical protein